MTVGKSIQKYRKDLMLSQEELGQKLLVSRQTVSLWEKDQTVPTIDNLIRLKEVFGISIDEILGIENKIQVEENKLREVYQLHFSESELKQIQCLQGKNFYKRPIIFILILAFLIISSIGSSAPDIMISFAFGSFLISLVSYIKGIRAYNKAWKNSIEKICQLTYEYKVFEDYIMVNIYRENEKIRELKCYFTDIEQINQLSKWLLFKFGGQSFIVRKSDLKENSAFYSFMYQNPAKITETIIPNKWQVISVILFVASLLSILGALTLVSVVSNVNNLFIENMWLFFLMTPIPVTSTIFGFILKAKGYKYKKNIIVGIIMTFFLCIYGSFTFIF